LNIQRDFKVVFKDKDWLKKTLIGGFFLMIPFLNVFSFGFFARFIHNRLETGSKELPSWNNWSLLFLKGLEWGVVIAIYFAIPLLILSLLPEPVMVFLVNPKFVITLLNIRGYLILFVSFLLGFVVMFFLPMALIIYSDSGSFLDGIQFQKIFRRIQMKILPYITAYLIMVVLMIVDFLLHIFLTAFIFQFGLISSYFIFAWLGFIIILISASLFIESF
jgi:hypothetical protein